VRYLGGKSKIAKLIAAEVNKIRPPGGWVWEPFCGGLSVAHALRPAGPVWSTDANPALISLYRAVREGWDPPGELSEAKYRAARLLPDSDPLKAFAGFGCSFAGKWFNGYARDSAGCNYAALSRRVLLKDRACGPFACIDFLAVEPRPINAVLYCDPPYAGTTGYRGGKFDSARFCVRVAEWSRFTDVFVSEYRFPLGVCVFAREQITTVSRKKSAYAPATERLFYVKKGSL
jgi:DNA adenine methylase